MNPISRLSLSFTVLIFVLLTSCDRDSEIKVYQVDKDTKKASAPSVDPPAGVPMPAAGAKGPHAGVVMPTPGIKDPHARLPMAGTPGMIKPPGVDGDVPDTWEPGRGSSMRLASYIVHGEGDTKADIFLIVLGGGAGGVLGNVNRWRAQVGLAAVDEEGLSASSSKIATPVGEGTAFDLVAGTPPSDPAKDGRIVAVIIPRAREMWFYKLRGNAELVAREKEGFLRWVASARKAAPLPAANQPAPTPTPAPPVATPQPSKEISWNVPDGWHQAPAKSMRIATFSVGAPDATPGEVSVIKLAGSGGGDLPNVNRWRGQIGLPAITADDLAAAVVNVESSAGAIALIDCAGGDKRTLAAWLRHDGSSWFVKLTGPSAVVGAEQARFTAFLSSLDFPEK